ncbi:hypothetical protein [Streptomyces sp. NPDC046887]|uniref:hypothetical protein n=1 Tax=Streptomyces sp. NPDC046887 TaxID=3155472 RepID=UPI0033F5EF0E
MAVRRRRHVREHHPNATMAADPNLAELRAAGLRPGVTDPVYAAALVHPLFLHGLRQTVTGIGAALRGPGAWHRAAALAVVLAAAYGAGGWAAVICGALIPRLLLGRNTVIRRHRGALDRDGLVAAGERDSGASQSAW